MRKLVKFEKYSATGNDFILINTEETKRFTPAVIRHLCHRKEGIGSDGILFFTPLPNTMAEKYDYRMTFFNPDGSPAAMCGNGARAMLFYAAIYLQREGEFKFLVGDRPYTGRVSVGRIEVNMGRPHSVDIDIEDLLQPDEQGAVIDSGVPYVVIYTPKLDSIDLLARGRKIRNDKRFALGSNVIFLASRESKFYARIYERGVEAETLSSGTGATAASFFINQVLGSSLSEGVSMPGGVLSATADQQGEYWLSGAVKKVFAGEFWL
jgi:diaminopimelate epimerase